MRKTHKWLLVSLLILSWGVSYAENKLSLYWEKQFSEKFDDVILKEVEIQETDNREYGIKGLTFKDGKQKISFPKVLIAKNTIAFLDKNRVAKRIQLNEKDTFAFYSPHRERFGVTRVNFKYDEKVPSIDSTVLSIYDSNGNKIINKTYPKGMQICLSDQGNFVSFDVDNEGVGANLYFNDANGRVIKEVKPFANGYYSYKAYFSKSGKYFVVSFDKFGDLGGAVICYDSSGNELWRKTLTSYDSLAVQIVISNNDKYVFLGIDEFQNSGCKYYSYLFDIDGATIFKKLIGKYATFSQDGNFLALSSNNELEMIDLKSNKSIWTYIDNNKSSSINSVDVSDNGIFTVIAMRDNPQNGKKRIILFNKSGQLIDEKEFTSDNAVEKLNIKIQENRKAINVINGNKFMVFRITGDI